MKKWLAVAVVLGSVLVVSVVMAQEVSNLCENGDFEKEPGLVLPGADKHIDTLVGAGWDLDQAGEGMALVVPDWTYDVGPAKIRIIEGEAGKEVYSGKRCLMIEGKLVYIYNTVTKRADKEYSFSLYARGKSEVGVWIFQYGEGGSVFLESFSALKAPVSEEWKKYEGTIKTQNPRTDFFAFALGVWGEVYIDDIVLIEKEESKEVSQ